MKEIVVNEAVKKHLPEPVGYVLDYCTIWLHGKCYFFRRNAKNEWIYEG